jgi:hypothetical protein
MDALGDIRSLITDIKDLQEGSRAVTDPQSASTLELAAAINNLALAIREIPWDCMAQESS